MKISAPWNRITIPVRKSSSLRRCFQRSCACTTLCSATDISQPCTHTPLLKAYILLDQVGVRLSTIRKQRINHKTVETHICLSHVRKVVGINIPTPLSLSLRFRSFPLFPTTSQVIWHYINYIICLLYRDLDPDSKVYFYCTSSQEKDCIRSWFTPYSYLLSPAPGLVPGTIVHTWLHTKPGSCSGSQGFLACWNVTAYILLLRKGCLYWAAKQKLLQVVQVPS